MTTFVAKLESQASTIPSSDSGILQSIRA